VHIAGGLYRETCELPSWNALYGSGGRAAAAVSALSPGTSLHTYHRKSEGSDIRELSDLGIEVIAHESNVEIAFAYFHPLSQPYIEPPVGAIPKQQSFHVSADTVLRFGLLEGEAIVSARRAIYDPQSSQAPAFAANGSRADELALVLNEAELRALAGRDDTSEAATRLLREENVVVVVAKAGARGATVFDRSSQPMHVPPYRSHRVFKIGTGDIFSAMFAHYWGEASRPANEAADLASRSVAAYCLDRVLPIRSVESATMGPVWPGELRAVLIQGRADTLGRRYVMEEARYRLKELGTRVLCPDLDGTSTLEGDALIGSILMIGDAFSARTAPRGAEQAPVVILVEGSDRSLAVDVPPVVKMVTDDFTTAVYWAAWEASSGAAPRTSGRRSHE
jgi:hypothetical protein